MKAISKVSLAIAVLVGLSACSSDDDPPMVEIQPPPEPVNTAPVITLSDLSASEKSPVTISAQVTDDGTINSFAWSQLSGPALEVSGADSTEISFVAPNVSEDQTFSFSLTATDDQNASTTSEVALTVTQLFNTITINGLATDNPIIEADITLQVGNIQTNTVADVNGNFSVSMDIDDDLTEPMVSILAQGKGEQQVARLLSIIGSTGAVMSAAGDDQVLSADELFSANVTNLTTAQSALMMQANEGMQIESDEQLSSSLNNLKLEDVLALATAIKVAIDEAPNNPNVALPEGVSDTLEMANNPQIRESYIDSIEQTQSFQDSLTAMLNDPDVVQDSPLDKATTIYLEGMITELKQTESGERTGSALFENIEAKFAWEVEDNILTLNFLEDSFVNETFVTKEIDGQSVQVKQLFVGIRSQLALQGLVDRELQFTETLEFELRFPDNPELATETDQLVQARSGISADSIEDFVIASSEPSIFALPLPVNQLGDFGASESQSPINTLRAAETAFNPDGTGIYTDLDLNFTWTQQTEAESSKQYIELVSDDNQIVSYYLLKSTNETVSADRYAVVISTPSTDMGSQVLTRVGYSSIGGQLGETKSFNVANAVGIYETTPTFEGADLLSRFWFELWPSGRAFTVFSSDTNADGVLSDNEISVQYGDWGVDDKNRLFITRYRSNENSVSSGCFGVFDKPEQNCYLYNERTWQLFAQNPDTFYVHHVHQFDFERDGAFDFISYDNRFFNKLSARPNNAQREQYLPPMPAQLLSGLSSVETQIDTMQFLVDPSFYSQGADSIVQMQFDNDGSYSFEAFGENGQLEVGDYYSLSDNSVQLQPFSASGNHFARVHVSDVFDLVAKSGKAMLSFASEAGALDLIDALTNRTSSESFEALIGQQLVLVDRDRDNEWSSTYISLSDENSLEIYTDNTFQTLANTVEITIQEDGSIGFDGSQTKLFIPLGDAMVKFTVTDENNGSDLDSNYLFTSIERAEQFIEKMVYLDQINKY